MKSTGVQVEQTVPTRVWARNGTPRNAGEGAAKVDFVP